MMLRHSRASRCNHLAYPCLVATQHIYIAFNHHRVAMGPNSLLSLGKAKYMPALIIQQCLRGV